MAGSKVVEFCTKHPREEVTREIVFFESTDDGEIERMIEYDYGYCQVCENEAR